MSIGSDRVYVPLPSTEPWEYWRLRKSDHGYPRILLWNRIMKPFSDENASDAEMQWSWNLTGCPVRGRRTHTVFCEITDNRSRFEWSDAIVFEANRLSMYDLPNRWPRFPIWVLWAPIHLSPDSEEPPNVYPDAVRTRFNWTMGRREDADIVVPYKSWRCGVRGDTTLHETAERNRKALGGSVRSGQVAWICSTCETEAYREIRESSWHSEDKSGGVGIRHVDMDTFDKCGRGTCTTPLECVRLIAAHYNFIVVRLQPDCFDSPYELIYEAFEYDLVPVVLAPPNTTLNVPPHSVVNSANIQQPGELAAFLAAIMDNPSEYQRYFTWKRHCSLSPNEVDLCPLCHALYEKFPRRQAHRDAYEWWKMRTACPAYAPPLYGLDWAFFKTDVPWL
ncbi:hypothetical protein HPB50_025694 [Hyalomma asiaticum]|uniref:Uncharacterized protein n=1 Tax=Hyalomma asiaticum TaxID=266040 RepID=A0ACB7SLG6_HYAAI|nr:hypothetical protein HPB50_025694 [Hyalomma asiaticum]